MRFVILTPGDVAPAKVSPVSRVASSGVARTDCLGPGAAPVAGGVVAVGLHCVAPGADDVRLPEVVGGGIEGLGGGLGLQGGLQPGLQSEKNI